MVYLGEKKEVFMIVGIAMAINVGETVLVAIYAVLSMLVSAISAPVRRRRRT